MRTKTVAVAAAASVDVDRWCGQFDDVMGLLRARFARVEPFRHARDLVAGLLSDLPRKNCWTIAEYAGHLGPDRLQTLLRVASWDHDGVRDDMRDYVVDRLGGDGAVFVIDETGDVKKGQHTVGVARQYSGTAGRVENAQVAVHLIYATSQGHAFIDAELYLPKSWTGDADRLAGVGVPADVEFATKPELAEQMIARALDSDVRCGWVAGDEVYGNSPGLRQALEERQIGYVLGISCHRPIATHDGERRADRIADQLPTQAWQRLSAGDGTKGKRWYDWARITIDADMPGCRWLLIRRNRSTGELAYYRCYAPHPIELAELVAVAGKRWRIEESFQAGKGLCGLDEHQVRTWTSWRRWVILSMLAFAFLAATKTSEQTRPTPPGMIPLTCNEISHLINVNRARHTDSAQHRRRWSHWRRRHQHRARLCHYRRRGDHKDYDLRL